MNVIFKNYICWFDLWLDSEPMSLEEAIPQYKAMMRHYVRGLVSREPILVDMDGNEITVD